MLEFVSFRGLLSVNTAASKKGFGIAWALDCASCLICFYNYCFLFFFFFGGGFRGHGSMGSSRVPCQKGLGGGNFSDSCCFRAARIDSVPKGENYIAESRYLEVHGGRRGLISTGF